MKRVNNRRVLGWSLFALLLASIAWALYAMLPPEPRWVLRGHIGSGGITPDGKTYVSGRFPEQPLDGPDLRDTFVAPQVPVDAVQYWDIATGQEVAHLLDDRGPILSVALSNEGKLAALASLPAEAGRCELRWMDRATGRDVRTVFDRPPATWQPRISPSGTLLLLDDWNDAAQGIYLYETASLRLLAKARHPQGAPLFWMWSPDGNALYLNVTDTDGNASLRRIAADGETALALKGVGAWLAMSPDGKTLLTTPADAFDRIFVWDLPAGVRCAAIPINVTGHPGYPPVFTPDSRTLIVTMGKGEGDTLGVWDMEGAQWLGKVRYAGAHAPLFVSPNAVIVHENAERLACYQLRPFARLWQHEGKPLRAVDVLPDAGRLVALSLGAESGAHVPIRTVMSAPRGGDRMLLLDLNTGTTTLDIALEPDANHTWLARGNHFVTVSEHKAADERGPVREFIEDRLLAFLMPNRHGDAGVPTTVRDFDIATGIACCRIDFASAIIDTQALTPDGQTLVLHQTLRGNNAAVLCYDLPPRRPWRFILGMPFALGATLLAARFGWRRIRRASLPRQRGEESQPA